MQVLGGAGGATVEVFINHFGNFGVAYGDISIYIEHSQYNVAIGEQYYNNLNEQELIDLLVNVH